MSDWMDEFEQLRRELMEEVKKLIDLRWEEREKATEDLPSIFDDEIWVTLVEGVEGRLKEALYSVRAYLWEAAGPLAEAALGILREHVFGGNLPVGYKIGLISVIQKAIELSIFLYKWQRGDLLQLKGREEVPEEVKRNIDTIIRLADKQVRDLESVLEKLPSVEEALKSEGYASIAATLLESYWSLPEEEREATERRVQRFYEEQEKQARAERLLKLYRRRMDQFKNVGEVEQKYQELVGRLMAALEKVPGAEGLKERIMQVLSSQHEFIWELSGELYDVLEEIEGDSEEIVNVKRKLADLIIFLLEDAKTDLTIVKEKLAPEDEEIAEMCDETIKLIDYNISEVRARLANPAGDATLLRKHIVLGFVLP